MAFALRYWKFIAGGLIAMALIFAFVTLKNQRDSARERNAELTEQLAQETFKLEVSNLSIAELERSLDAQNERIIAMRRDADARLDASRKALAQAKREGRDAVAVAGKLRSAPKAGGNQCETSDTLMKNRDKL